MSNAEPTKNSIQSDLDATRESALRAHDDQTKLFFNVNEACIKTGESAVKTVFIMNGGASVATLAFIGALVGSKDIKNYPFFQVAEGLTYFAWGVVLSAIATGSGYLTNYFIASKLAHEKPIWEYPFHEMTKISKRYAVIASTFQWIAVFSVILSIGTFVYGINNMKDHIVKFNFDSSKSKK